MYTDKGNSVLLSHKACSQSYWVLTEVLVFHILNGSGLYFYRITFTKSIFSNFHIQQIQG